MILEIWQSFRTLPLWVQIWVGLLLAPINLASLWFIDQPSGGWVALLAVGAMMMNMPVMAYDRGFSKLMAFPHLIPWSILVIWVAFARPISTDGYATYLSVLMVTNIISLGFDFPDALNWWKGDREPARP